MTTLDEPQPGDYRVEYAPSGRSTCKLSKSKIKKGELRIGLIVQAQNFDGTFPIWYRFSEFAKNKKAVQKLQRATSSSSMRLHGLENVRPADQDRIRRIMQTVSTSTVPETSGDKTGRGRQRKRGGKRAEEEKEETEDDRMQRLYREESNRIWELKDKLKNLRTGILKEMLALNDQCISGGEDTLIDRCAFGMMFGALPRCPKPACQDNWLTYRRGKYVCTGGTEWANCTFEAENVDGMRDWQVPGDTGVDWLDSFSFVRHQKVKYVPHIAARNDADSAKNVPPFEGLCIALAGKLNKKQAVLGRLIKKHGGEVSSSISTSVDILVTSQAEWNKSPMSIKLKNAKQLGIPIVVEEWIDKSIEAGCKLSHTEMEKESMFLDQGTASESFTRSVSRSKRKRDFHHLDDEDFQENALEMPKKKIKLTIKGHSAVDPECSIADDVHVYEASVDEIFSVHLSMTDIRRGTNSFYIIQILQDDRNHSDFNVWRRWGRTGTNIGSSKLETDHSLHSAVAAFKRLYYEKTGNSWENRNEFVKMPRKFAPIEISYTEDDEKLRLLMEKQNDPNAEYHGSLDPRVRDFVKLLFDMKEMQKTLASMEIDTDKMPLGKLSSNTIEQGLSTLRDVSDLIAQRKNGLCEDEPFNDQIISLSNKFYTFIPHRFDEENPIRLIDNEKLVKEKLEHLDTLREMEVATSIILSSDEDSDMDLIDQHYTKLNAGLTPLDEMSEEFKLLEQYVNSTHAPTHSEYKLSITAAFKIQRQGESERYESWKDLHNQQLLWHGSRLTNWVGIISQGLRIAPPEAPATGYMFGKGIYFASSVSKSANYCFTDAENNTGVLLLSQVALGNTYTRLQAEYITNLGKDETTGQPYHSTWGLGKTTPDPKQTKSINLDGIDVKVPCGKLTSAKLGTGAHLLYDEFIVYDVSQIQQRYLLQVQFNYKRRSRW